MTNPGALKSRLVLEEPVEVADGAGGVVRSYTAVTTLWAEVVPIAARGEVIAAASGASITHRIVIRAGREVTTRHRLRNGSRIYRIVSVRERDGRGRFLDIHAEERAD